MRGADCRLPPDKRSYISGDTMSQFENPYAPSGIPGILENTPAEEKLATLGERFAGALIDGIINIVILLPLAFGVGFGIVSLLGDGVVQRLLSQVLGGLIGMVAFLAVQGYFLATRSQTIGKMVVNTKIVSDSGQPLSFGELYLKRYLIPQIASILPYVGGLIGLINVLAIFRSNRKCVHDEIAGTKVIKLQS
jgi:uncharacterized RDD family membrane protein YckC